MERARVVLVTNVGQGFGRAVALAYGRAGYHVVCADRDVDLASKTAAEVEELGGQAIPIQADMTTQMDVLTTYQKVLEIFGALGGVVHLATHVSTTPFENLAEGEFYEIMAEDVRSSFLILKTAARLLSVGWVVVVAPPHADSVQMMAVQGALRQMVDGFRQRFSYPRANLVVPSRQSSDPRHDQALVRAVRYLGSPESTGVSGQAVDIELPDPPRISEALLPEVRAALDISMRQDEDVDYWPASTSVADVDARQGSHEDGGVAGRYYAADDHAGDDDDDYEDDYEEFDLHWSEELGLRRGAPALRHVVGDDPVGSVHDQGYAAGLEPAVDLYGDLSRLEGSELDFGYDSAFDRDGELASDGVVKKRV
ncbi:MAG TPA: SDR family NAD(P)-dependent oxidoreductase [Trueperaceae bacterium]|nr:SDR family NAD(P)-dependent oxidoreductase [Trueperaceae bacterium]